jgi:hypothetical protein
MDIPTIWIPIIAAEVRKLQLRSVQIMQGSCVFMLALYTEFVSLVKASILVVL